MMRPRDDGNEGYKPMRPTSPLGIPSEQADMVPVATGDRDRKLWEASNYLQAVKDATRDNSENLTQFVQLMADFGKKRFGLDVLIMRVRELFKEHPELIVGFNTFLPETKFIAERKTINFKEAFDLICRVKNRFHGDERHDLFLVILNNHRMGWKSSDEACQEIVRLFEGNHDLLEEFLHFIPCTLTSYKGLCQDRSHDNRDKIAKSYDLDGDHHIPHDNPDIEHEVHSRHIERDGREDRNASDHDQGEKHFKCESRDSDRVKHGKQKHSQRVGDSGTVQLKQVREDVENSVPCRIQASPYSDKITSKKALRNEGYSNRSVELLELERERGHDGVGRQDERDSERESDNETKRQCITCKPASDLDVSNCRHCTPSYRLELDENYKRPPNNRTKLAASVLNDDWRSVVAGSEDNSFRCVERTQYEEIMLKAEDDRFEMDMILERLEATIRQVTGFLDKIEDKSIKPDEAKLEAYFTSANLRCIERLYGDYGLIVMGILRSNASIALPVILTRLMQKQEECERFRSDYNKAWLRCFDEEKCFSARRFYRFFHRD